MVETEPGSTGPCQPALGPGRSDMSMLEGLHQSIEEMGFAQLAMAFAATAGYALALNGALAVRFRLASGTLGFVGAAGFAIATASWMNGVVLMTLVVVVIGGFVAGVWALSALLGRGARPALTVVEEHEGGEEATRPLLINPTATPAHSA